MASKWQSCIVRIPFLFIAIVTAYICPGAPVMAAGIPVREISLHHDLKGSGTQALSLPTDVAVGENGNIYVVDSGNHRVAVFNSAGSYINTFGGPGKGTGQLLDPVGIDVDGSNNVYVADKGNRRIQVFQGSGAFVRSIALQQGSKKIEPVDVSVSEKNNRLYVTGNNTHSVHVYNMSGRYLETWGGEGTTPAKFRFPATLAQSSSASSSRNIYVVDVLNSRVQVLSAGGKHIINVGEWGVQPGQLFRPKGVAVDSKGNVYISDSYLEVVQVFDSNHRFLYVLKHDGKLKAFEAPVGMTTDKQGRLYVVEMTANKVSVFSLE